MSFSTFPATIDEVNTLNWESYEPYFTDLQQRDVDEGNLRQWLKDWSKISAFIWEAAAMIYIKKSLDTADEKREKDFLDFENNVRPLATVANQQLKERFLSLNQMQ